MFNLIDNYIFIIVNGCVCSGPVHCFSMLLRWHWLYIEIVHRLVLRSRHEICPVNQLNIKNATGKAILDTLYIVLAVSLFSSNLVFYSNSSTFNK